MSDEFPETPKTPDKPSDDVTPKAAPVAKAASTKKAPNPFADTGPSTPGIATKKGKLEKKTKTKFRLDEDSEDSDIEAPPSSGPLSKSRPKPGRT